LFNNFTSIYYSRSYESQEFKDSLKVRIEKYKKRAEKAEEILGTEGAHLIIE
jgi:hypothetical protein